MRVGLAKRLGPQTERFRGPAEVVPRTSHGGDSRSNNPPAPMPAEGRAMLPTNDTALRLAVDRLEWALQGAGSRLAPVEPVLRALDACGRAFAAHVALCESPHRLFALVDPTLLPFTDR